MASKPRVVCAAFSACSFVYGWTERGDWTGNGLCPGFSSRAVSMEGYGRAAGTPPESLRAFGPVEGLLGD